MNLLRKNEGFKLAEERALPGEEESLDSVIETFATYMRQNYRPGEYQRGGNTKTHGVVRGEFIVRDDVPAHMRHGVFAKPHTYRTWVQVFRARVRTCPRTSRMSVLSAAPSS